MEQNDLLQIKRQLRLAMDGQTSARMRDEGYAYKLNYGASYPSLKRIASQFQPNIVLAKKMYCSQVREQMILSTILYPLEQFTEEEAIQWINTAPYPEIIDYLCMNILQKLDFTKELIQTLIISDRWINQYAALQLINRVAKKSPKTELLKYEQHIKTFQNHANLTLRIAAWNCLEKISTME